MSRRPHARRRAARARRRATLLLAWAVLGAVLGTVGTVAPAPLPAGATPVPSTSVGVGRVGSYPENPVDFSPTGGPPPLTTMPWYSDRDCGFSAPTLNRLARLYVFCDSYLVDARGEPRSLYIPSNVVALSPDPLFGPPKPRDPLKAGQQVTPTIPFPDSVDCGSARPAVWPHSVATLPDYDGDPTTDRFAIYFRAYCTTGPYEIVSHGVGVAFVDTDTDLPHTPVELDETDPDEYRYPISGMVVDGHPFAAGANVVKDAGGSRHMYLYRCDGSHPTGGGCYITRRLLTGDPSLDAAALGTGSGYQILRTDGSWGIGGTPKRLSDADGEHDTPATRDPLYEPAQATIAWVPELGMFVMTYNHSQRTAGHMHEPAEGYFGMMTSEDIAGPWSEPIDVQVPAGACESSKCYQVAAQPAITDHERLGYTFRDGNMRRRPLTNGDTKKGTLHAAAVPLSHLGDLVDPVTPTDAEYVDWLYRQVLNRIGSAGEVGWWSTWLTNPSNTRAELVDEFTDSTEFKQSWANRIVYDVWQYRRLSATERAAMAGTWTGTFEAFERTVAASDDTYERITGSATPSPEGNEVWLHHLYQAAMNRLPDAAGYAYWLGRLNANPSTRWAVAGSFLLSTEARTVRVQMIFKLLLGRSASAGDLAFYLPRYQGSGSLQQLVVDLGGTTEAYAEANRPVALPLE